jgi:hypothetical protein
LRVISDNISDSEAATIFRERKVFGLTFLEGEKGF